MLRSLWQHVQLHEGQEAKSSPAAHCIHCGHRYAANTTRILAHMTGYGGQVQKCSQLRLLSDEERAELAELVACKREKKAAREQSRSRARGLQPAATGSRAAAAIARDAAAIARDADAALAAEIVSTATSADSLVVALNGCAGVGGSSSRSRCDDIGTLPSAVRSISDGHDVVPVAGSALAVADTRGTVQAMLLGPAAIRPVRKRPRHPSVQEPAKERDRLQLDKLQGHVSELDDVTRSLVEAAIRVKENSYCPYSNCRVGAAIMSPDGRVFAGCSVENASYGLALCAERAAVTAAIAAGVRKFTAVAISRDVEGQHREGLLCGACWQTLIEFGSDWDVYSIGPDGLYTRLPARYVLPLAHVLDATPQKRKT